jgi:8-oxo-dGTP pyrophosphatase MutT (NUDIX family)
VYSYVYKDTNGTLCSWEGVNKPSGLPGHKSKTTMATIAVLKRQIRCDCLLLVRQFRAPVGKYTIEFPATVVDGQGSLDTVVQAANREIQDETGYTSTTFKHISPDTAMDADVTDGMVKLVSVSIDGDDPLQHAAPANTFSFESGHGHIVQLLQLPLNGLLERLRALAEQDVIDSRVYAYAMGLQEGEKIAISNMLAKEELNEM